MIFDNRFPVLFANPTFPRFIKSIADFMILFNITNWFYPLSQPSSSFGAIWSFPAFQHSIGLLDNSLCHFLIVYYIGSFGHRNKEIRPEAFPLFLMCLFCYDSGKPGNHSWMINPFLNHV